jgi:cysteinyl-tRNA synthetase, unknown class
MELSQMRAVAIALVALVLGGAAHAEDTVGLAVPGIDARAVKRWHYQLQNVDPTAIAQSDADMVVVDLAGEDGHFSRGEVEAMRRKPDGTRRLVLAYMSIGEAESYRWYWAQNAQNRAREWLGRENKRWRGNYAVRFWHPQWQAIIFDYADRIVDAGFDGVYLDRVDIFEEVGHGEAMVEFVERIAQHTKAKRPGFLVISQNGDALIADARFRAAIDGFAREDLFYGENADGVRNDAGSIAESIARLRLLAAEGKPVFVVEYPKTEAQAQTASREIAEQNFIGLLAKRALDRPHH